MAKQKVAKNGNGEVENGAIDSRLSAVRDLIFGENIQEYDKEFTELHDKLDSYNEKQKQELEEKVTQLEAKIDELQTYVDANLEHVYAELEKKILKVEDNAANRKKLGKALERIAHSLLD